MMFHFRHRWVEMERFQSLPAMKLSIEEFSGGSETIKLMEQAIHGTTTILYRCCVCNDIKTVELLGKSK